MSEESYQTTDDHRFTLPDSSSDQSSQVEGGHVCSVHAETERAVRIFMVCVTLTYVIFLSSYPFAFYAIASANFTAFWVISVFFAVFYGVAMLVWAWGSDCRTFLSCLFGIVYLVLVLCFIDARTSQIGSENAWNSVVHQPFANVLAGSDNLYVITDGFDHIRPDVYGVVNDRSYAYRVYPMYVNPANQSICNMSLFWTTRVPIRTPIPSTFYANFDLSDLPSTDISLYQTAARNLMDSNRCPVVLVDSVLMVSSIPPDDTLPSDYDFKVQSMGITILVFYVLHVGATIIGCWFGPDRHKPNPTPK